MGADRPGGREEVGSPVARRLFVPCIPSRIFLVPNAVSWCMTASARTSRIAVSRFSRSITSATTASAGVAQPLSVGLAAGDADDLVAGGDELAGERCTDGAEAPASRTLMASSLTCFGPVASVVPFRWFWARVHSCPFPDSGRIAVGWVGLSRTTGE